MHLTNNFIQTNMFHPKYSKLLSYFIADKYKPHNGEKTCYRRRN